MGNSSYPRNGEAPQPEWSKDLDAADALYLAMQDDHARGETFSLRVSVLANKYRERRGIPVPDIEPERFYGDEPT